MYTPPANYQPYMPPPGPKSRPVWPWILGGVGAVLLAVLIAVGVSSAVRYARQNAAGTAPATSAPAAPARQAPVMSSSAPTPTGPVSVVSGGTYKVGVDMLPGTYKGTCGYNAYWARLHSDDPHDIITNDWNVHGGLMQFTTKAGEYVTVSNCTFTKQS